jgi:hypothetical protein
MIMGRIALVFLAGFALPAPAALAVIGGHPVTPASIPQVVRLPSCSSSLIAPDRLATAAHLHARPADAGRTLSCEVRATNSGGTVYVRSAAVAVRGT